MILIVALLPMALLQSALVGSHAQHTGRMTCLRMLADDDLAAEFAAEQRRRELRPTEAAIKEEPDEETPRSDEPFTGIKEIVLGDDGRPRAIPRRPAPPPAATQQEEVAELLQSPLFFFGTAMSVGALGLLLAIAGADSAAQP